MAYTVQIAPAAERQLAKLDRPIRARLAEAIDKLAANPRPAGVKKLVGEENAWRIRVGDYRIVYEIHDRRLVVLIIGIGHRGDVYR